MCTTRAAGCAARNACDARALADAGAARCSSGRASPARCARRPARTRAGSRRRRSARRELLEAVEVPVEAVGEDAERHAVRLAPGDELGRARVELHGAQEARRAPPRAGGSRRGAPRCTATRRSRRARSAPRARRAARRAWCRAIVEPTSCCAKVPSKSQKTASGGVAAQARERARVRRELGARAVRPRGARARAGSARRGELAVEAAERAPVGARPRALRLVRVQQRDERAAPRRARPRPPGSRAARRPSGARRALARRRRRPRARARSSRARTRGPPARARRSRRRRAPCRPSPRSPPPGSAPRPVRELRLARCAPSGSRGR